MYLNQHMVKYLIVAFHKDEQICENFLALYSK